MALLNTLLFFTTLAQISIEKHFFIKTTMMRNHCGLFVLHKYYIDDIDAYLMSHLNFYGK